MSDAYEMWCECGRSFYGTDSDSGSRCAQCRQRRAIDPRITSRHWLWAGTPLGSEIIGQVVHVTPEARKHIDIMEYTARWHHRCGKYPKTIVGGCDKPLGHGGYCAGPEVAGATPVVFGMDRGMPIYDFPCSCGRTIRGTDRDRGKQCTHAPPQPPTLREWLGDRVAELGRWADVLREQPVPAGMIVAWEWRAGVPWALTQGEFSDWSKLTVENLVAACEPTKYLRDASPVVDSMQMALFTRHPDVKPEPRPAAFPWDPYPEVI